MKLASIVIDSNDSEALSDFYEKLLNWKKLRIDDEWIIVYDENKLGTTLTFQQIDNYQTPVWPTENDKQQQMVHLDFYVEDKNFDSEIKHAIKCGATEIKSNYSDNWKVMLDPAGHPFCIVPMPKEILEQRI